MCVLGGQERGVVSVCAVNYLGIVGDGGEDGGVVGAPGHIVDSIVLSCKRVGGWVGEGVSEWVGGWVGGLGLVGARV